MHETMEKVKHLCEFKETLCEGLKAEFAKGIQCMDVHETGAVIDMLKDLAVAEEKCWEACYYKKCVEEMEEEYEEEGRAGYNSRRYASGRYAPKGRGHISGYTEMMPNPYWLGDHKDYPHDHMPMRDMVMGYRAPESHPMESSKMHEKNPRYGQAYNAYQDSKRHYTVSNSPTDKEEMERHANEHVSDTIATIREIYKSSDPDLRKRIKADMTKLVGEMPT